MIAANDRGPAPDDVPATSLLGHWAAALNFDDIPGDVVAHLKMCLLDGLGCAVYGSQQPWGRIAAETVGDWGGGGRSVLFGHRRSASAPDAALVNGTALHGFEIDDVHVASSYHPASITIPAVFAVGDERQISGKDAMTALAAGYEAGIRLGVAAGTKHSTSGYHVTGTVGAVGSAVAAARALALDAEGTTHAIGIGATQAAGLYSARLGAMAKRFHAGRASQSGVVAAYLARRGFTGSKIAIEAPVGGFLSTLKGQGPASRITDDLGTRWETRRVGFKIYAACASAHTIVDALDALMKRGLTAANLRSLEIGMSRKGALNVGWDYKPAEVVSAQMNGYYTAAVKLVDDAAFVDQYRQERLADPRILALIGKMKIFHDETLDAGGAEKRHAVNVTAELLDGQRLDVHVEQRSGSAEHPLSHEQIRSKFVMLTRELLPEDRIAQICDLVARLEELPNVSVLSALLSQG